MVAGRDLGLCLCLYSLSYYIERQLSTQIQGMSRDRGYVSLTDEDAGKPRKCSLEGSPWTL